MQPTKRLLSAVDDEILMLAAVEQRWELELKLKLKLKVTLKSIESRSFSILFALC